MPPALLFDPRCFDPRLFDVGVTVVTIPEYWYGTLQIVRQAVADVAVCQTGLGLVAVQSRVDAAVSRHATPHVRVAIQRRVTATVER